MVDRLAVVVGMVGIVALLSVSFFWVLVVGHTCKIPSVNLIVSIVQARLPLLLTNIVLSPELHLASLPHLLGITRKPKDLS